MNIATVLELLAGGPGSGCNPEAGKCGRPEGTGAVNYMQEKMGGPQGTNPGGMYKASDGKFYYVKTYGDSQQSRGEHLANRIYRSLSIGAPVSNLFKNDGKDAIANKQLEGKTVQSMGMMSQSQARDFMNGFAADILTANWDAVGKGKDNIFITSTGAVYRLDQGGALLRRAQGGMKPESVLNGISEAAKFLDKSVNKDYADVAQKAGVTAIADLGAKTQTVAFKDQVEAIVAIRNYYGGWDKYVALKSPDMPQDEQKKIADMLTNRTILMVALSKGIQQDEAAKATVPSSSTVAPKTQTTTAPLQAPPPDTGGKWRTYNPNNVGGYFRKGTTIAQMYQTLAAKEGQWHPIADFEQKHAGGPNILNRIQEMKYTGQRSGRWTVEKSGDSVRIFLAKAGDVKQAVLTDKQVATAKDLVDKVQALKADQALSGVITDKMKTAFAQYYTAMGVSSQSQILMEKAIKDWTYSAHGTEAQGMRQVAMQFYNRKAEGEYTDGVTNNIKDGTAGSKAEAMKDGVMAMKAYASEYARQAGVNVVYRGLSGKVAQSIKDAIAGGATKVNIPMNALSSWSEKKGTAQSFSKDYSGGVIVKMKIDPDNVWAVHAATPWLFSAHSNEAEYIVGAKQARETFDVKDITVK